MFGTSYAYYTYNNGTNLNITTGDFDAGVAVIFSQNEYINVVFNDIKEASYRRETHKMTENYGDNRRSYTYHILSPVEKDFYVKHI